MTKKQDSESIELNSVPNKLYENFFKKFEEIDTVDPSKWKGVHLIGYFARLYKSKFGFDYSFKFDRTPSTCYEAFQIKRLSAAVSADPAQIKEYIDWVFINKVTSKTKFRVIGFLVNQNFIFEFKADRKKSKQISRMTVLPDSIQKLLADFDIHNIQTYGDLSFLKQAAEGGDDDFNKVMTKLNAVGFDCSILEVVK